MVEFILELFRNKAFITLIIFIVLDTIFGILRAIRERSLNSCIGIDGIIRKSGMLLSILFFFLIDKILEINLLGFIPKEVLSFIKLDQVGVGMLFSILYIVFESLSVLKNMYKCKIPIPAKLKNVIEKILSDFTEEIKKGELQDGNSEKK